MTRKHLSDDADDGLSESRYVVDSTKNYNKFYLTRSRSWLGYKVYRAASGVCGEESKVGLRLNNLPSGLRQAR